MMTRKKSNSAPPLTLDCLCP